MMIIKKTATTNTTAKKNRQIKYIVIHYTAGTHSEQGQALAVADMFARGAVGGSADFIVDDVDTVQYNGDIRNRYCWSVGGSKYTSMSTSEGGKYYNICTNWNSISIEMCSNKKNKKSLSGTDNDWYLTTQTVNNAVELTKYLMKQYKIPAENVIMHHHVTGKLCPQPWTLKEAWLVGWNSFKKRLTEETRDDEMIETMNFQINGTDVKMDAINKEGNTFAKIRGFESAGFDVEYNKETKLRTINNKLVDTDIVLNGKKTSVKAYNINGHICIPARTVAEIHGENISYDDESKTITLSKN